MLYALLDCSATVEEEHLRAALAIWEYCEASARHLFGKECNNTARQGGQTDETLAVRLLNSIRTQPGSNRRSLYGSVGGRATKEQLDEALIWLQAQNLAHPRPCSTEGRPRECWFPGSAVECEQTNKVPIEEDASLCLFARSEEEESSSESASSPSDDETNAQGPGSVRLTRMNVLEEEIAVPPGGSLMPMSVAELLETVRGIGGRFIWVQDAVTVVAEKTIAPAVLAAVVEHQAHLQLLVPKSTPEDYDLFLYRMRITGTEEERDLERREVVRIFERLAEVSDEALTA